MRGHGRSRSHLSLHEAGDLTLARLTAEARTDAASLLAALAELRRFLERRPGGIVVLDLEGVECLAGTGLARLVGCLRRAREGGGDLVLSGVGLDGLGLLELWKLNDLFVRIGSVEEALELRSPPESIPS